jgi:ABC-type uncharacterized transport system involved in gliding motility auxiliary subunit
MTEASPSSRPSFSAASRWRIGFDLALRTLLVLAVVGMVNYLAARHSQRFYLSEQTRVHLSPRTLSVLHAVTNRVEVTLYYDTHGDPKNFYPSVKALLEEYSDHNSKLLVRAVDYNRDPGEAAKVKEKYQQYFGSQSDKDLVIFDCAGRVRVFPGSLLVQFKRSLVAIHEKKPHSTDPRDKELEYENKPVQFNGEQAFTSILLALANPQPLKAYFLQGNGEFSLADGGQFGYQKFASVLQQNYLTVSNLVLGHTGVPMDCNLLVIASPSSAFSKSDLQQISQYLQEGGRLLMLFSYVSQAHPTGLEPVLENWGVQVMDDIAQDFDHSTSAQGYDLKVDQFRPHPVVDSLARDYLQIYLPRPILKLPPRQTANAPQVDELFATSPGGTLMGNRSEPPHQYPLACAIEQKPVAGVTNPRGNTRIVVVGDASFLGNVLLDYGANRDFLNAAVNWLCDRPLLLAGIGPRPVTDLHLQITRQQQRQLNWVLLGALPGAVLVFGWFIWLVRRK